MPVYRLSNEPVFPDPRLAEANGLLAVGGDLKAQRLIEAYANGIFPWYSEGEPILWFSPDPRMVLLPQNHQVSKSLRRVIESGKYETRIDTAFREVVEYCSQVPRPGQDGTWITRDMIDAYCQLRELGLAHSFETYQEGKLVGGLYGVSLGKAFFGESMFHHSRDASKVAFARLVEFCVKGKFHFIDAQVPTDHLRRLGAEEMDRETFLNLLREAMKAETLQGNWG